MNVWTIADVTAEPQVTLTNWQVLELPSGDRHLVGYAIEAREGRVSSCIQIFDRTSLRAVTRSGRTYQLHGRPGIDRDAGVRLAEVGPGQPSDAVLRRKY